MAINHRLSRAAESRRPAELLLDRGNSVRVSRLDRGGESGGNVALVAGWIFAEIPARRIERLLQCHSFGEGRALAGQGTEIARLR